MLGAACVVAGVFFALAFAKSQESKTRLDEAKQSLVKIYGEKVFPDDKNIAQIKENQKTLEEWFASATNQLAKSEVPLANLTPAQFKQKLVGEVREMIQLSSPQGVAARVNADFYFGFDRYKDGMLPEKDDVPRLNQQLDIIKLLVEELNHANIVKLDAIEREIFEADAAAAGTAESGRPRPPKNKPPSGGGGGVTPASDAQPAGLNPALADLFDCQRFTVSFQAHPDAFADVLNKLSAMSLFVVVAEMEIKKAAMPRGDQKKETGAKPNAQAADAFAPVSTQYVTNPEDEPPISVRLSLDVYSFKGV